MLHPVLKVVPEHYTAQITGKTRTRKHLGINKRRLVRYFLIVSLPLVCSVKYAV